MDRILLTCERCGAIVDMKSLVAECACGHVVRRYDSRTTTLADDFAAWDVLSDEAFNNFERELDSGASNLGVKDWKRKRLIGD